MDVYSWNFAWNSYGNRWRRCRRLFHEFLNVKTVSRFDDYVNKHTRRFLSRLAETPDGFLGHTQLYVHCSVGASSYAPDLLQYVV